MGKVQKKSVVLLISYSGETGEILALIPALKRLNVTIIALTGVTQSTLTSHADIILDMSVDREACPLNLAPTTSTMITMVLGDALAVGLMELKDFKQEDFALTHPGGSLGRKLLSNVKDEMKQVNLPFVRKEANVQDVLLKMTEGRLGLALVGSKEELEKELIKKNISQFDPSLEEYKTGRYIIKGCSDITAPAFAMTELMKKIQPTALSIMYGEPCSTVPVYKKK